ncbi:MAG: hypothetical protein ABIS06_03815 [Vicinamibacterales bacterium]
MSRFRSAAGIAIGASLFLLACSSQTGSPTAPSAPADSPSSATSAAQPPFNLEAILRGDGFGLVKFRQQKDPTQNIINLDVWVRDLLPNTSYSLQRAVDTTLNGVCTGTNWLTLGQGLTPQSIQTDDAGTGRAALWRDLSSLAAGTAFDIYFRVIQTGTTNVALQSDCYRFVVRD